MAEEADLLGQDSDGDSEEVVLTPAELIDRLEQVSSPHGIPCCKHSLLSWSNAANVRIQEMRGWNSRLLRREETASYHLHRSRKYRHSQIETS